MKSVLLLLSIFACIVLSFAAQSIIPPNPDHPGVCIFEGKELEKGENNDWPDKCIRLECGADGSIVESSCGVVAVQDCTPGDFVDVSRPYPECCKRHFTCKDENGEEVIKDL